MFLDLWLGKPQPSSFLVFIIDKLVVRFVIKVTIFNHVTFSIQLMRMELVEVYIHIWNGRWTFPYYTDRGVNITNEFGHELQE